jgi:hypothetical protein
LADASGEGRGRKIRIMEENERQQEERWWQGSYRSDGKH